MVYNYDALGRRVSRQERKVARTEFIYDGMDVIQDRKSDGSGASVVNFVNGLGIDNKLKQTTGSTTSYFLTDHLGSTVGLADQSGSLTLQTSYDSFGNTAGPMPTRYGYTGREQDEYTGLYYYRARFYDPQIGRFISEDPIGFRGGINWYAYVGNNPLGFTDPLGLMGADNGFSHLPQYEIQKRIEQCKAIRILLERERMHGTGPASWISSVTFGSPDTMLTALNNRHYGNISVGGRPFDMDWFMDSKAVSGQFWDLGPFAYVVGKVSWSAKNKLTGQPQTYPWPYQDPGELEAALALSNNKSYKDIFTEEWFKEYCPCE